MKSVVVPNGSGLWGWMIQNEQNEAVAVSGQAFTTYDLAEQSLAAFVLAVVHDPDLHRCTELRSGHPVNTGYL